jgi:hypothetical protein
MNLRPFFAAATLLLVAACTTPFTADVARFQRMPAPSGESFVIEAKDKARAGGLEFAQYAAYVENALAAKGYSRAASPDAASLIVRIDYGVNDGREKVTTRTSAFGPRFGAWYGYPYYYPWRRHYYWSAFYDPFWDPFWGRDEVYSYTVYRSYLDMDIVRRSDGSPVFEGRAEATTRSSDLTTLVPNLTRAMFDNFPGQSGQTVRVRLDPKQAG